MPLLTAQVTSAGISAPDYAEIYQQFKILYWSIYGADANLDADSLDGQFLSSLARALYDTNQTAVAVYNSFPPTGAQGVGLSNMVKLNGIRRHVPTNSQAAVTIVGQVGRVITNGIVGDSQNLGTRWALPETVTIPAEGFVVVTATSVAEGAVSAAPDTLTEILTPTLGWQSVTNAASASVGEAVEIDADLRRRQAQSVAVPSQGIISGIYGAIADIPGVERLVVYENTGSGADGDGIPGHSISAVVGGGDVDLVAEAIAFNKAPGTGTYGTTTVTVTDPRSRAVNINFFVLADTPIQVAITLDALPGYLSTTGAKVVASIVEFLNTLTIGEDVYRNRMISAANLSGVAAQTATGLSQIELDALAATYNITALTLGATLPLLAADVTIAFNKAASGDADDVGVTVT